MPLPTIEELAAKLQVHVDAKDDQATFIAECAAQAVEFITGRVPNTEGGAEVVDGILVPVSEVSPLGVVLYAREVIDLGADLFYRRQAKNGIVSLNTVDGSPVRIASDPYKAAAARLATLRPLGFV